MTGKMTPGLKSMPASRKAKSVLVPLVLAWITNASSGLALTFESPNALHSAAASRDASDTSQRRFPPDPGFITCRNGRSVGGSTLVFDCQYGIRHAQRIIFLDGIHIVPWPNDYSSKSITTLDSILEGKTIDIYSANIHAQPHRSDGNCYPSIDPKSWVPKDQKPFTPSEQYSFICEVNGIDVRTALILQGLGTVESQNQELSSLQDVAEANRSGIWWRARTECDGFLHRLWRKIPWPWAHADIVDCFVESDTNLPGDFVAQATRWQAYATIALVVVTWAGSILWFTTTRLRNKASSENYMTTIFATVRNMISTKSTLESLDKNLTKLIAKLDQILDRGIMVPRKTMNEIAKYKEYTREVWHSVSDKIDEGKPIDAPLSDRLIEDLHVANSKAKDKVFGKNNWA